MRYKTSALALTLIMTSNLCFATGSQATEFDHYLQSKNIINKKFKITEKKQLNELLESISAEDSRTLPLQVDQNTIVEKLALFSNRTALEGIITTPDFNQLEIDLGKSEIKKMIEKNLLNNCTIFFEHQYQRANPYHVDIILNSDHNQYKLKIKQKECGI